MVKHTLLVNDMLCSNCAMKIEGLEDELAGVKSIAASYAKGRVVVEFDELQVSLTEIVDGIKRKGYTVG